MPASNGIIANARSDREDWLIEADEPLAGLQIRCGGELPGKIAIPELLENVRKARSLGLRLARTIHAFDGNEIVRAWVEIAPDPAPDQGGCAISVGTWHTADLASESDIQAAARHIEIDRELAELTARLDREQRVITVDTRAADLRHLAEKMRGQPAVQWSELVAFPGLEHRLPLHWRLLDGATCRIDGSAREWTATIVPLGEPTPGSAGFELFLVAQTPFPTQTAPSQSKAPAPPIPAIFGQELTPALRQPITRIIANAETIRAKLAGPLAEEYSAYAADIASAGQHLLSLIEDLSDLEVVESDRFSTAPDSIDLADVVRRASGILGVRAQERGISIVPLDQDAHLPATGEFRRVLQILLNLLGNAIRYSPEGSRITLSLSQADGMAQVAVMDEGSGLTEEQIASVFGKFERLGRSDDGGSGLGLYISRRLARAMGGDLTAESAPGQGARFILSIPARDEP
ncbi:sensor histidine kinase [Altererythrobacter sp. FM1]|uniref:sensor histidine kinase n=1 Tax=Tsuneonella flava TaxID=2055955 RepID=UPI000C80D4AC|nr:HAMP domain-containing sensor histidine kinase [Tsuneonella flava]ROT95262.1 sensor histidine kinase [Altererythrobacter sp. FM1]